MNRRNHGAASVGVVWVIVLLALLLFAGGGIYVLASEKAKNEEAVAVAEREAADKEKKYTDVATKLLAVSGVVGFNNPDDPTSMSNPEQISGRLGALQEGYSSFVGKDASNLSRALERFEAQVNDLTRQLAEAKQQTATAEASRASSETSKQDVTRQKDEAYSALNKQLTDERDRHSSQESEDRNRIDDLNKRLNDHEARARAEKEDLEKQLASAQEEIRRRDGRIAELSKKVEFLKLPDEPDGSVVDVSSASTCYIDLGNRQLLRRGTRFKVFNYGKGGEMREKGMVEVSAVQEAMAECRVIDVKDRFDPIAKGDRIAAPNFDPQMPREFVLTGRFPTGYSRAMVADRLRALGANVSDKVGPSTDFLIMGDSDVPAAAEGEEGEEAPAEGEEGAAPAESEEMKLAQLYRVQVLPVREILEYLKYE